MFSGNEMSPLTVNTQTEVKMLFQSVASKVSYWGFNYGQVYFKRTQRVDMEISGRLMYLEIMLCICWIKKYLCNILQAVDLRVSYKETKMRQQHGVWFETCVYSINSQQKPLFILGASKRSHFLLPTRHTITWNRSCCVMQR